MDVRVDKSCETSLIKSVSRVMIDYPWRYVQTHIQSSVGTHNNNVHGIMESPILEEMVGGITLFSYPYIFSFIEYGTGKLTGVA